MTTWISRDARLGNRIIKVNHAGEHGAVCIYSAQMLMARFTAASMMDELTAFQQHERQHRNIFQHELTRRKQPRCRSYWLCGIGGYALGLATGLLGRRAIAATTLAVEKIVLQHLEHQLASLQDDPHAVHAIRQIVSDERLHHDRSASHLNEQSILTVSISFIVTVATRSVIWLGMRL